MSVLNKVLIAGNVARDPDVRVTQAGQKVAKFTLATNEKWKDKTTGETREHTDFNPIAAWGYTAEYIDKYVHKGDHVLVEGKLKTRDFDDPKTGQHRWVTEVLAERIYEHRQPKGASGNGNSYNQPQDYQNAERQAQAAINAVRPQSMQEEEFPMDFSSMPADGSEVEIPF